MWYFIPLWYEIPHLWYDTPLFFITGYICKYSIDHVVDEPEHNDEEKFPDEYKKILQLMVQVLLVEDRLKVRKSKNSHFSSKVDIFK
jgi:hypothetical protein